MKFYLIGEDKSLKDVTELVLALAGGTMTGDISFQGTNSVNRMIHFLDNTKDGYGNGIAIGGGGITIIGGGESASTVAEQFADAAGEEKTIISADAGIDFYVNCQNGAAGAKIVSLSAAGLLSGHQKAISSGTAAPSGGSNGDIYIQY